MSDVDIPSLPFQRTVPQKLTFAIVLVLFLAFFAHQHQMHYSVIGKKSGSRDEMGAAITSGGNFERRIAFVSMGTFFFFLLFRKRRFPIEFGGRLFWLLFIYIGWSFLSIVWADSFHLVSRRLVIFAIFCLSAYSLSLNVPLFRLAFIVQWTTLIFLLVGIFSEYTTETLRIFGEGYRFAGTCHPESQALNCSTLFLAAMITARSDRNSTRKLSLFLMFVALVFLLMTRSRGPTVGLLIAFLVCKFYSVERSKILTYFYVVVLILCVAFLIFGDAFGPMVGRGILLGRPGEQVRTLTGRVPLWAVCFDYAKVHPIGGYGFDGFWTEGRMLEISDSLSWTVNSSHSLYIETVLNLGFVGLAIFLALIITGWLGARRVWRFRGDDGMALALGLLTLWMADGVLSTSISGMGFATFLALVVLFSVAREIVEVKRVHGRPRRNLSSAEFPPRSP